MTDKTTIAQAVARDGEFYGAWCSLDDEGTPIAASVRNSPEAVPGEAVQCLIVVRRPSRKPPAVEWRFIDPKDEHDV